MVTEISGEGGEIRQCGRKTIKLGPHQTLCAEYVIIGVFVRRHKVNFNY